LRDVGTYAQALAGWSIAATPTLLRYELIRDRVAQPLPSTEALIALASQHTLTEEGAAPTERGLRKLGLGPLAPPIEPPAGQPLFFVDHDLIPDPISRLIPELILPSAEVENPFSAVECTRSQGEVFTPIMAGTPGILSETSDSPQPPHTAIRG